MVLFEYCSVSSFGSYIVLMYLYVFSLCTTDYNDILFCWFCTMGQHFSTERCIFGHKKMNKQNYRIKCVLLTNVCRIIVLKS